MISLYDFLLKSNIIFTVLYFIYVLIFNKNTFHNLNRAVLLFIIVISCSMPFISVDFDFNEVVYLTQKAPVLENHFVIADNVSSSLENIENFFWTKSKILYFVYLIGVLFTLGNLISSLNKVFKIKKRSIIEKDGRFKLIYSKSTSYFSFFNWIFIPEEKRGNTCKSIINHEKLHGIKKHSVDLIFTEFFKAFLWFNPFVYFFQKKIKTIHEYQVDKAVLKNQSLTSYLQVISNNLQNQNKVKLYNYFGELTIKKRIKMITKNKTSNWNLIKYLSIVPILIILLMSFNLRKNNTGNIPSILPIKKGQYRKISSSYGKRTHTILKVEKFHNGIDFIAKIGTEIRATADGVIKIVSKSDKGYGNMVVIKHGDTYETWYSQMKKYIVTTSETVKKGQVIGYVGSTGASTGPHLHYEVRKNNEPVNPEDFFSVK